LHHDQLLTEKFAVRGSDYPGFAEVRITLDFLKQARTICAEEMRLIDVTITKEGIPFPKTLSGTRKAVDFTAQVLGFTSTPVHHGNLARTQKETRRISRFVPRRLLLLLARRRISGVGRCVLESARFGSIIIAGSGLYPLALAHYLRLNGRSSVVLAPGYGTGTEIIQNYLLRPAADSLIGWILKDQRSLEKAGAVILFGEDDFTLDIDALRALDNMPPVFLTRHNGRGTYSIAAADIGALSRHKASEITKVCPRISIVIVSFNQAAFLESAILSVIGQNYPDLDLIIVDGGSTDGSIDIIERYRPSFSHVVIEPDQGQSDALNKGFALATGEVLNWLCSDDIYEPGALQQVARAYMSTRADLIVGGCARFDETHSDELFRHHTALVVGRKLRFDAEDVLRYTRSWLKGNYFYQPEVFFSRRIWDAAGAHFKRHLYYLMDYDLWLRMALAGASVYHVPACLGGSRVHPEQKTANHIEVHQARQIMAEYQDLFCTLNAASKFNEASSHKLNVVQRYQERSELMAANDLETRWPPTAEPMQETQTLGAE